MNRYLPLLLCCIIGCASANGDFQTHRKPPVKTKIPEKVQVAQTIATHEPDDGYDGSGIWYKPKSQIKHSVEAVIPAISLPEKLSAKPGAWIKLKAKTNCPHVIWINDDETGNLNLLDEKLLVDLGVSMDAQASPSLTIAWSIVPGQYRIKAIAALADQPVQSNWCVITIMGPQPPPGPTPPPIPPDPPVPPTPIVTGPLQIITLDNVAARTPAIAAVVASLPYWQSVRKAGNSVYLMDSNSPQAGIYAAQVQKVGGLPVVMFGSLDVNKKLVIAGVEKLPPTLAGMTALIQKYGGKTP